MYFRGNIGVVSTDPKTELRKLRTNLHGYGMGLGSEWSMENWPLSPGEPIRGKIEQADRQHGRARRVSWLMSRLSSPASRPATRPCSPGELACVMAGIAGRAGSCRGRDRLASWLVSRPSSTGDPFRLFVFSAFEVLTEIRFF
ncbi:hypothetical protein F2Q69_00059309 [Brassica cretica]|uniref:Uncharacterized protein n=1 Tax=Brassica cretica TaxID=69181 RepID=A0A8S9RTS2_BRACR|nr:hypothetical protein F2Q69_00059309 [Brassica cretica]